jgi:isopentenyl phosphate kinase
LSTGNISIIGLLCIYTVQLTCQRLNSEIFAVYIKTYLNINIHFPHFFANGSYATFDHSAFKALDIAMTKKNVYSHYNPILFGEFLLPGTNA